ncbi:MAG TPA: hypothetical protein VG754_01185, partial [Verrucomicrobiae bacterium]|nr:hypothetical protein [Verrucomicrobiae bacterium]
MFHFIKRFWVVLALTLAGAQTMFGFAMLGPFNEGFQVPAIGYNLTLPAASFGNDGNNADVGAPKNYGQGYRWNTPTNYYAFDESFSRYFGATGESNIDAAFAMFNNLTNVSNLNLDQWPLNASRINYRAQALQLLDLKSYTMSIIIEQLGLAQPDRWVWCLHDRFTGGATCPGFEYSVIQRNYDPYTYLYSSYVNGVFYDYQIEELCALTPLNPFAPLLADAIEIPVDPTTYQDTTDAVAAYGSEYIYGSFFLSFTRDDIGGLKCLYSATNAYPEMAESNSVQIVTNTAQPVLLVTSNLAIFESQALTNDDA